MAIGFRTIGTWIFHGLVAGSVTLAFSLVAEPEPGAFAAWFFYLGMETKGLMLKLKAGGPTWEQWIDKLGDMAGPTIVVIVVLLLG